VGEHDHAHLLEHKKNTRKYIQSIFELTHDRVIGTSPTLLSRILALRQRTDRRSLLVARAPEALIDYG